VRSAFSFFFLLLRLRRSVAPAGESTSRPESPVVGFSSSSSYARQSAGTRFSSPHRRVSSAATVACTCTASCSDLSPASGANSSMATGFGTSRSATVAGTRAS
jgi:hypothetical protein